MAVSGTYRPSAFSNRVSYLAMSDQSCVIDLSSKARALRSISSFLSTARVLPIFIFNVEQWTRNRKDVIDRALSFFDQSDDFIVRSSSCLEGCGKSSNAGRFTSVLSVKRERLSAAIHKVVDSYDETCQLFDEIFIQPMAIELQYSGVASNYDCASGLPYIIINVTHGKGSDLVTSGQSECQGSVFLSPNRPSDQHQYSCIFSLLDEIQTILTGHPVEIEFGVDQRGVILFQVRPIQERSSPIAIQSHAVKQIDGAHDQLLRLKTCFPNEPLALSVMADWNPAEMIGIKPRPLAYDLYATLITSSGWATGRVPYGYRDMTDRPLMYQLLGTPYIHLSSSILSLLPSDLPDHIAASIVNGAIDMLREQPDLHDKIEFRLVPSCVTPDMVLNQTQSRPSYLSSANWHTLVKSLLPVTASVLDPLGPTLESRRVLDEMQELIVRLNKQWMSSTVESLQSLLDLGINRAVPAFSLLARAAFVVTAIIKNFESSGIVHIGFSDLVIGDVRTVTSQMRNDATRLSLANFLELYGHLRPGTYDIRALSYAEAPDSYFTCGNSTECSFEHLPKVLLSVQEAKSIEEYLVRLNLPCTALEFISHAQSIIACREYAKFALSCIVSHLLRAVEISCRSLDLSRDDMSFLHLYDILTLNSGDSDPATLASVINERRSIWELQSELRVPYVVFDMTRFDGFDEFICQPSYVSSRDIIAPAIYLNERDLPRPELCHGRVILLEAADPGFDWIFTVGAAGLVTAFGGENSHMTVRAREFGLPAAIGIGETRLNVLKRAQTLRLNCVEHLIEVVE